MKKITLLAILLTSIVFYSCQNNNQETNENDISLSTNLLQNQNIQQSQNIYNLNNTQRKNKTVLDGKDTLYLADLSFLRVGKRFSSENLEVFQILGKEEVSQKYITLSEALKKKYVTVFETETVNSLAIKNNSNYYVFIHSGDIVKGGKQDRTIQYDIILQPNSKKIDLASFCVEQNRWQKRGEETLSEFTENSKMISSKKMKLATKYQSDQSAVWSSVSDQQTKINGTMNNHYSLDVDVTENESSSSLQLTLENKELAKITDELKKAFSNFDNPNVLGFAYFINGKIYGIDIYNNHQLFSDLWDKQLNAIVTESISERNDSIKEFKLNDSKDVLKYINYTEQLQKVKKVNNITALVTGETEEDNKMLIFSTIDRTQNNWLHKSYLSLD